MDGAPRAIRWRHQSIEPNSGYVEVEHTEVQSLHSKKSPKPLLQLPTKLSSRKLRARLYQIGFKGETLRKTAKEILAGPPLTVLKFSAQKFALGWPEEVLESKIGQKSLRRVMKGVRRTYIFFDEMHQYMDPALKSFYSAAASTMRKFSADLQEASQRALDFNKSDISIYGAK